MYEYPFGNGQQLNLDWFLAEWKNLLAAWEAEKNGIDGALQAEIDKAEAALADVFAARDAAAQSAANALESKNAAAQSASDASGYLSTVQQNATTAQNAAQGAAQSESNAAESAQTALASKNTAAQSERNAAQSEANANTSKNAAAQSAADALANKDAAAQSAADALANKNAAAQSAEDASDAAASVEASAQQISTNTADINNLKEYLYDITENIDFNLLERVDGYINADNVWNTGGAVYFTYFIPVINGQKITLSTTYQWGGIYALLKTDTFIVDTSPDFCIDYPSRIQLPANSPVTIDIPSDCNYIAFRIDKDATYTLFSATVKTTLYQYAQLNRRLIYDVNNDLSALILEH